MKYLLTLFSFLLIAFWVPAQNGLLHIKENGKWGLINEKGEIVVEPTWDMANGRSDHGVVSMRDPDSRGLRDKTYAIVDTKGNFLLGPGPYLVNSLGYYIPAHKGLMRVHHEGKDNIMDLLGNFQMETWVDGITHFSNKTETTFKNAGKFGVINHTGKILIPAEHPSKEAAWKAHIVKEQGEGYRKYDKVLPRSEGLSAVYTGKLSPYGDAQEDNWGFANAKGEMVIPAQYSRVHSFSQGLSLVKKGDYRGVIDLQGKYVIPMKYKFLGGPVNDRFLAIEGQEIEQPRSYLFDLEGTLLHTFDGELSLLNDRYMSPSQQELMALSKEGNGQFYASEGVGVIRVKDGKEILPPIYNYVRDAGEGITKFAANCECDMDMATFGLCTVEEQGYTAQATGCKFGLVDDQGKVIFEPIFDNIGKVAKGKAYAVKAGELYVITMAGEQQKTDLSLPIHNQDAVGFYQLFAKLSPHQPVILEGYLALEGKKLNPTPFPQSKGTYGQHLITHIRDDIYCVRVNQDSFGYVRLPSQVGIYWCGEEPAGLEEWMR